MGITNKSLIACLASLLIIFAAHHATAGPWIDPGDKQLRHHLQVLNDYEIINAPLATWPLMWSAIANDIESFQGNPSEGAQWSLAYVRFAMRRDKRPGLQTHAYLSLRQAPLYFDGFSNQTKGESAALLSASLMTERQALKLNVHYVDDNEDNATTRHDGSYASSVWGNWSMATGSIERWWGPAWQNSLILSTNARPIPSVTLQRIHSHPFASSWLRWIGPWHLVAFIAEMEKKRAIPNAKLFGLRINFKPIKALELGISRTAQWGGEGRPQDGTAFYNLLVGKENPGSDGIDFDNDPGNQLAGIDWRWSHHNDQYSGSYYGQIIGEDESGYLPSKLTMIVGADLAIVSLTRHTRFYFEAMDTTAGFIVGKYSPDAAYEHTTYVNGYRYLDRSIAAATDNDSRMYTFAIKHLIGSNVDINGALSRISLNRDEENKNEPGGSTLLSASGKTLWLIQLSYSHIIGPVKSTIGLDYYSQMIQKRADTSAAEHLQTNVSLKFRF